MQCSDTVGADRSWGFLAGDLIEAVLALAAVFTLAFTLALAFLAFTAALPLAFLGQDEHAEVHLVAVRRRRET